MILYTIKGENLSKEDNISINCKKGSWSLFYPDRVHSYKDINNTKWSLAWIHFKGKSITNIIENLFYINNNINFFQKNNEAENILFKIINLSLHRTIISEIQRNNLLIKLLLKLHEMYSSNLNINITNSINYIHDNYKKKINLTKLSGMSGFSKFHFSRIFKNETGYSPINYIIKLKIEKAKELLEYDNHLKIKEIAKEIGYDDEFYFSKIFKIKTTLTPREYKNKYSGLSGVV